MSTQSTRAGIETSSSTNIGYYLYKMSNLALPSRWPLYEYYENEGHVLCSFVFLGNQYHSSYVIE